MLKRMISLLLCMAIVFSVLPVHAFAMENVTEPTEIVTGPEEEETEPSEEITASIELEMEPVEETPMYTEEVVEETAPVEQETLPEEMTTMHESQLQNVEGITLTPYLQAVPTSISFEEETETTEVGFSTIITAIYVSESEPQTFDWKCSVTDAVLFSETSIMGPTETNKENTWWISATVTGITVGSYVSVKPDSVSGVASTAS